MAVFGVGIVGFEYELDFDEKWYLWLGVVDFDDFFVGVEVVVASYDILSAVIVVVDGCVVGEFGVGVGEVFVERFLVAVVAEILDAGGGFSMSATGGGDDAVELGL